jgi:hypothetical protein
MRPLEVTSPAGAIDPDMLALLQQQLLLGGKKKTQE